MHEIKKIVVLGPESSGKTTLCQTLAEYYQTHWVPEYARTYLKENGSAYQWEDLEKIAAGQLELEEQILHELSMKMKVNNEKKIMPLFIDTDLHVIKLWSDIVFGSCSHHILKAMANRSYDFYILCKPDLEWAPDPLRENPEAEKRERHYHHFLDSVVHSNTAFALIEGIGDIRTKNAIEAIDEQLSRFK